MKIWIVDGYKCPHCGEFIPEEVTMKPVRCYECDRCGEIYDERDEAEECCKE